MAGAPGWLMDGAVFMIGIGVNAGLIVVVV
jgi:hypothetical protein